MRTLILTLLIIGCLAGPGAAAQNKNDARTPVAVIQELYKAHNSGKGAVFDGKEKALLLKYFDAKLSDAIWKELTSNSEEVGNLNFDPLFYSQDIEIRNLRVTGPAAVKGKTVVTASFNNYTQKTVVRFHMRNTADGWRVENVVYEDGEDLLKILATPL